MEHTTIHMNYIGISIHRNNIDKMEEWLNSFSNMSHRRRLLWITPNKRKTLKAGDMIIVDHLQDQVGEGGQSTFMNRQVPLAVYSSSNLHRSWSRGMRFMDVGTYIMHQKTSAI